MMPETHFRANCPGCFFEAKLQDVDILRALARNHTQRYDCDPGAIELEEVADDE